jgi:hypothetical protein
LRSARSVPSIRERLERSEQRQAHNTNSTLQRERKSAT